MTKRIAAAALACTVLTCSFGARAQDKPTKDQCLDAHESAQLLERQGKLIEARDKYRTCGHAACPALVRQDCEPKAEELRAKTASVRLEIRGSGEVTIDDQPAPAAGADGTIELDPGEHVFRLRTADGRVSEQRVELSQGKRDVSVVLREPAPAPAPAPSTGAEPRPADAQRKLPTSVYVLGGVAVVGLAGFVGFAVSGRSKQSELDECKPNCRQSDFNDMERSYLFADISLGVAAIAGGVATYIYLTHKRSEREGGAFVSAAPTARGGLVRAGVSF